MKAQQKKTVKKEIQMHMKVVNVTLHKLENSSKEYWLEKAKNFRSNVQAVLVGLEENHEEEKGLHAHILIQFTTRLKLSRKQFVDYFETECLHIALKSDREGLLMGLGYISKTGNTLQYGVFSNRGQEIEADQEAYRFKYMVKTREDGVRYFKKVIEEHISDDTSIIKRLLEKKNAVGDWLLMHPSLRRELLALESSWRFNHAEKARKGFHFVSWIEVESELEQRYKAYLEEYPVIFEGEKAVEHTHGLEEDYDRHMEHDLKILRRVVNILKVAQQYRWKRPMKSMNLYLWSKNPSFGKTRLLQDFFRACCVCYRLPEDQYYLKYDNNRCDMLISDEAAGFIRTKDFSHIKLVLEGRAVEFNMKGKTKGIKTDNPLMILTGNESFDSLMTRSFKERWANEKQAFEARILDLELKSRATLHFFIDCCLRSNS